MDDTIAAAEAPSDDARIVAALRAGDERAFAALVDQYGRALERLAYTYVRDREAAADIVQEAWMGLLGSIDRFEGRSSLKTWLFRILVNCARARARKESRTVPFSALADAPSDGGGPAVEADSFQPAGARWAGHWSSPPGTWPDTPEASALSSEVRRRIDDAIARLPDGPRAVITLRDVEGFSGDEVCNLLEISDTNQRVLLHRARAKVRRAMAEYFQGGR